LFEEICATASFAVAFASPARIDRDNILRASLWALARAVAVAAGMPKHVFVDGRDKIDAPCDCDAVIGGDGIVHVDRRRLDHRQVTRDRLMSAIGAGLPGLRLRKSQGLRRAGTSRGAGRLGPSIHHRRFFAPVVARGRNITLRRSKRRSNPISSPWTGNYFRDFSDDLRPVASAARALYQTSLGTCRIDVSCASPRSLSN
jgi:ribonuclease HII